MLVKWFGTLCGIAAAIMVASNNGGQMLGYILFLCGSVAWFYDSIKELDRPAMLQWFVFCLINAYGIINYA